MGLLVWKIPPTAERLFEATHEATGAKLVVHRYEQTHNTVSSDNQRVERPDRYCAIGWVGWTGYRRSDDESVLRWYRVSFDPGWQSWATSMLKQGPLIAKPRVMSGKPRDRQCERVYRWENAVVRPLFAGESMSLDECRAYVDAVWAASGRRGRPPRVIDGRGTRNASGMRTRVNLPRWARMRWVILHELAHSMTSTQHAAHGREFTRCYVDLLVEHLGISEGMLRRSAADMNVEIG